MAESKVSVMATIDSRLVREETAMESSVADSKVSMVASKEPVVFRGRSRSSEHPPPPTMARISRLSGDLVVHRGGRTSGTVYARLWLLDPEVEGPCIQGSPVHVFSASR